MRRFVPLRSAGTLVIILALFTSCSADDPSSGSPEERLAEVALGVPIVVRGSDDAIIGVVGTLIPPPPAPPMVSPDIMVIAGWFLDQFGDFWGIENPATDLVMVERTDGAPGPLGGPSASLVYQRVVGAYEVLGARLTIRIEDGLVRDAMGIIPRELDVAMTPTVSDADAISTVLATEGGTATTASLVVVSEGLYSGLSTAPSVLAWQVAVDAGLESRTRFVDAESGALLELVIEGARSARNRSVRDRGDLLCANETPPITDDGACVAWIRMSPQVYDESGPISGTTPSADATQLWDNLALVYDVLMRFGRDSFDGRGGTFVAYALVKDAEGSGEAVALDVPYALLFSRGMATLDVVAHETGHLFLASEGFAPAGTDAQAIHEGFGDVLGAIADDAAPWTIGEGSRTGVGRTLSSPSTLSDVSAGADEHDNGLVVDYAFYRGSDVEMVAGRPVIGKEKAGKIWIHMADRYLIPGVTLAQLWLPAWLAGRELAEDEATSGINYYDCAAVLQGLHGAGIGEGDRDGDCVPNDLDICPDFYNPDQADGLECLRPFGSCQLTDDLCINYHSRDDNLRTSCEVSGGVWTEDACVEENADAACVLYTGTEDVQIEVYYNLLEESLGAVQCFFVPAESGGPGIFTPTYIRPSL